MTELDSNSSTGAHTRILHDADGWHCQIRGGMLGPFSSVDVAQSELSKHLDRCARYPGLSATLHRSVSRVAHVFRQKQVSSGT